MQGQHGHLTYGELHRVLSDRWTGLLEESVVVGGPYVLVGADGVAVRVLSATLVGSGVTVTEQLPNDAVDVTPCVRGLETQLLATRVWH
jgi:hypothetical protein